MSLSKLINRKWFKSVIVCNQLFAKQIFLNSIETTNRFLSNYLSINKQNIFINNENKLQVIQRRHFKQRDRFSDGKGCEVMPNSRLVAFITSIIALSLVFEWKNIWENSIPHSITDTLEYKAKRIARIVENIYGIKPMHALTEDKSNEETNGNISENNTKHSKSRKNGFRDRKIIEYENKIRMFSNPDKVFRYFASLKIIYDQNEAEIYMTPDDFLRALTPGIKQPDGLGLDQFRRVYVSKEEDSELSAMLSQVLLTGNKELSYGLKGDSIFYKLSNYGLINYSDFLFLLTVISVSRRHFEIAFRMFDLNGDGNVEYDEFEKVQNAILSQTSIGKKLGTSRTGYKGVSSALAKYFFGEDLKQKLTTEKFLDFQKQLQTELLTLEFERKKPNPISGKIKESDFANLLIAYAGLTEKRRTKMLKRVQKKFGIDEKGLQEEGISLDDYLSLYNFLQNINDVDIALAVFNIAGASIDQETLKHVAKTVAHVELSDHLVDVLFTLFDENQDGQLSNKEFIAVMKERLRRGLTKPKDTGFLRLLHAIWNSLKFDL